MKYDCLLHLPIFKIFTNLELLQIKFWSNLESKVFSDITSITQTLTVAKWGKAIDRKVEVF